MTLRDLALGFRFPLWGGYGWRALACLQCAWLVRRAWYMLWLCGLPSPLLLRAAGWLWRRAHGSLAGL